MDNSFEDKFEESSVTAERTTPEKAAQRKGRHLQDNGEFILEK